ncbi:MAG TPA: ABC transporter substrate-binding protein [Acidimicrobiales bacterium]
MSELPAGRARLHRTRGVRRRRRLGAVAVAVVLLTVAAACGDDDGDDGAAQPTSAPSTSGSPTTEAPDDFCTADRVGGELTMSVFSETRSLDPTVSTGTGTTGGTELSALYDTLMRFNDETYEYEPWVAESLEPNEDNSVWTLKLRPGVKFGNGDPLTAEAVKASIARHQDPNSRSVVKPEVAQIQSMEVVDDLTLRFVLVEPWGLFPYVLADMAGMIVNPRVVEERGADFGANPTGAGVGPYELVHYRPGEEILFRARDDYWGGPVCIQQLRFIDIVGEPATYEALKAGTIDVMYFREPETAPQARADGFDIRSETIWLGQGLIMNHSVGDPVTADLRIRQAVAHALDAEVLSQRAFGGQLIVTDTITPETSPYHVDVEGIPYDPDRARQLVEEAKAGGWDGSISLVCGDTTPEVGIAIETMLNAVGFQVNRESLPISEFSSRVYVDRDYELACGGAGASDSNPWIRLARFYGPNNYFTTYQNEEFNAALRELKLASTPAEAKPAIEELQRVWNETVPSVGLGALEAGIITRDRVHGVLPNVNMMVTFAEAYVDQQ